MKLISDADLLSTANQALDKRRNDPSYRHWTTSLTEHLNKVQGAGEDEFRSHEFQKMLWESEAISATGLGKVPTSKLWNDTLLVDIFWRVRRLKDDGDSALVTNQLVYSWDEALTRIRALSDRIPRLKLARVFASLRPQNFTTLAYEEALIQLARELGVGHASEHKVVLHQRILDRLDTVLDKIEVPPSEPAQLVRLKLPWLLYQQMTNTSTTGVTVTAGDVAGKVELRPLPPSRRRRGLMAIGGYLPSVLAMIQFAKDGCSREDFKEHVRAVNPKLAMSSINTNINALIADWGLLAAEGDQLTLTPRGTAFLESEDPEEVSDWLLTQILGFDNALYLLKQQPLEQKTFISDLQQVNPGWTTTFAPSALLGWLRELKLVESKRGLLALTPRGEEWASRIHWIPGRLEKTSPTVLSSPQNTQETDVVAFVRPPVRQIIEAFPKGLVFPDRIVAQLDAALWSHPRRHFAVLTGLSGAGKTQLACSYGMALWRNEKAETSSSVYVLPVQPGWHDPSALLGYVNPLNTDHYVRTGFLNFLLDATRDPERPYTVVLDEMNLSHPEQYLAPLLSAMETGGLIELHAQDDDVDQIPPSIAYPNNLLIIGTVNMDETTHGLSDKVLDRASVIEFWDIDTDQFPGWHDTDLEPPRVDELRGLMKGLGSALSPARLHFGWRTLGDVLGYVRAANTGGVLEFAEAVDQAVYAKVLPKLRGEDSPRLRKALEDCETLFKQRSLRLSASKVGQLLDDLSHLGTARFWR